MQGRDRTSLPVDKEATGIPRLCCEHGEVPLQSNPENRISGVHHRFRDNDLRAPQSEDKGNQARMQKALAGATSDSTSDCTHNRGLSCNSHCNHSSTTALSCSPTAQKQKSLPPPLKEGTEQAFQLTKKQLESLGFVVNMEKSLCKATQRIEYLGFIIDSETMTFELPKAKIKEIKQECRKLLQVQQVTVRQIAHIIGVLAATRIAITPAPLHYHALQRLKNRSLSLHHSYESKVSLDQESRQDLTWWIAHLGTNNGRPIHQPVPDLEIESDASNGSWGACCNGLRTRGQWSRVESALHINGKELLAAFLAVQTFAKNKRVLHIRLKVDNMTAVYYINHMGGTRSLSLMKITMQFWNWCLQKGITISAEHLPGQLNVGADQESWAKGDSSDWRLNPMVFQKLMSQLGPCQVDLFASRLNAQLESYMSWKPNPGAIATDALSQPWTDLRGYAFPPFSLIGRCLSKIQHEKVPELILIAPVWPTQPWYPVLKASMFQKAILLPPSRTFCRIYGENPIPYWYRVL